jgi:hypothetical protein
MWLNILVRDEAGSVVGTVLVPTSPADAALTTVARRPELRTENNQ